MEISASLSTQTMEK